MRISSIVRVSTQGVSRPYVCQDDAGRLYWCKGNHTGLKALISEWVCAKIAHAVHLPVPECFIARVDSSVFVAWCACNPHECPQLITETNPFVFASSHVEMAKDVINVENDLRDVDCLLLAKIYLFDAFIRNTDRTDYNSNLLVNGGVHVIDHNNAFDLSFDRTAFARDHILRRYHGEIIPSDLKMFDQELRDTVTSAFLDSVWSEMPSAWTDTGESAFSLQDAKRILLEERK